MKSFCKWTGSMFWFNLVAFESIDLPKQLGETFKYSIARWNNRLSMKGSQTGTFFKFIL